LFADLELLTLDADADSRRRQMFVSSDGTAVSARVTADCLKLKGVAGEV